MNENKENQKNLVIESKWYDFSFDEEFKLKHGKFVLKTNHRDAGQVMIFTVHDIEFIRPSERSLDDFDAFVDEIDKQGYVPLDVRCANALYKAALDDYELALCIYPELPFTNIVFLGSTLAEDGGAEPEINHYAFFEYDCLDILRGVPRLVCSHNNPGTLNSEYVAAVFKKSFFKEEETTKDAGQENQNSDVAHVFTRFWEGELSQDNNPKKESGKMPTIEQCQAKTIELLREQNAKLIKERDDLLEKYENLKKISNPKLSAEMEELLITRVCDLGFSNRVIKALDESDIVYVFQLIGYTKEQLHRLRKLGKNSIDEISQKLREKTLTTGITFRETEYNYFWDLIERRQSKK